MPFVSTHLRTHHLNQQASDMTACRSRRCVLGLGALFLLLALGMVEGWRVPSGAFDSECLLAGLDRHASPGLGWIDGSIHPSIMPSRTCTYVHTPSGPAPQRATRRRSPLRMMAAATAFAEGAKHDFVDVPSEALEEIEEPACRDMLARMRRCDYAWVR